MSQGYKYFQEHNNKSYLITVASGQAHVYRVDRDEDTEAPSTGYDTSDMSGWSLQSTPAYQVDPPRTLTLLRGFNAAGKTLRPIRRTRLIPSPLPRIASEASSIIHVKNTKYIARSPIRFQVQAGQ